MHFAQLDFAHTTAIELRLSSTGERVLVLPFLGGTVQSIQLGSKCQEILFADSEAELDLNPKFRGRLLFPFNDRIPNARYLFEGREHQLPVNNSEDQSAIHGLIYNRPLTIVHEESSSDSARLVLATAFGPGEYVGYPFALTFSVEYLLKPNSLTLRFRFSNDGQGNAPIALGWHPYFKLGSAVVDDHHIEIAAPSYIEVDHNLLPTGNTPSTEGMILDFSQSTPINERELDHALVHDGQGIAKLKLGDHNLEISQDPAFFPYFQLYIPEDRQSIAIEPVSAATDSFNRPDLGLKVLKPGEEVRTWCQVRWVSTPEV